MSRIGKMPVAIPMGVDVKQDESGQITVKGQKGTLSMKPHKDMIVRIDRGKITVERPSELKLHKSLHGLTRSLINNMVNGVTAGFEKTLEVNGVGYRAQKQGKKLILNLGYSHPVEIDEIPGITIDVPAPNRVVVKGSDKQAVGQFAAMIRSRRKPEVYKGKGIRYENEIIKLKEGKAGAKGKK